MYNVDDTEYEDHPHVANYGSPSVSIDDCRIISVANFFRTGWRESSASINTYTRVCPDEKAREGIRVVLLSFQGWNFVRNWYWKKLTLWVHIYLKFLLHMEHI